ncbi:MAG TPA: DUF2490 domain-containing protein [Nitrosomonas nitrosa]|jgi:hypothetical protein|uniref:Uncharacterized protein n=1 Tax=Nitrosomonas nitrosa TaxID=52442 RepID=A0A1I4TB46_9PROT|nr:DUF2490 domain-containing protein [Nitrosomonas nitrosa]MCO6434309.1 DUF2490 domain-containing protein [Nitrosomonas nitrosa]PTR02248.1 uncharacterized protein DUF2490 [Nitrosomonas nitrosa]CAE6495934.1 conserved exported hypothetical protein [Nitrosomonas nitrosa]SFM73790.1 Protein of unknown function [Nitrosomonas nitrosa]HBZ30764.1 DUF2490 domain-containing protein [Nitrosomonas nitrosa]
MIKKLKLFTAIAAFGLLSPPVIAEEVASDFQTWGQVMANINLGNVTGNENLKNWRLWLEGQGRFGNDSTQFTQSLIRPGIGYAINDKVTIWAGYAWAPTAEPISGRHPYDEHRLWQQVTWNEELSFGKFSWRSRFEQRFFDQMVPDPGPNDVAYRFRQLIKLAIPMPFISPKLSFIVQDEIFIAMNTPHKGWITNGFDQNRGFVGLAWKFNPTVTGEVGYLNQYINRPHNARPDQMIHIVGVNVFLNF